MKFQLKDKFITFSTIILVAIAMLVVIISMFGSGENAKVVPLRGLTDESREKKLNELANTKKHNDEGKGSFTDK
jgi:ABC-type microcin C transport system permease subunit YejB